jgi:4-hydroxy-tetrahydrodipicolinate reductase
MKVLIHGISGSMGTWVKKCLSNENIEFIGYDPQSDSADIYKDFSKMPSVDVIIDFSHYSLIDKLLDYVLRTKTPLVLCTTGLSDSTESKVKEVSSSVPVFKSGNMSLGINVMLKLSKIATALLENFDIEIIEKHHKKKVDAPSGTAHMIADAIRSVKQLEPIYGRHGYMKRKDNEIGIHTVRGGSITGEHTALFAGEDEVIEIKHQATSKRVFAEGAVLAAKYLVNQPAGLYNMNDLLGGNDEF